MAVFAVLEPEDPDDPEPEDPEPDDLAPEDPEPEDPEPEEPDPDEPFPEEPDPAAPAEVVAGVDEESDLPSPAGAADFSAPAFPARESLR